MPNTKTVLDDLGSMAFKELVASFSGQEVKVSVGEFAITDTSTSTLLVLLTDVDVVLTDMLIGVDQTLADTDTDIIIDYDTDLTFSSPLGVILNVEGFDGTGLPTGVYTIANVTGNSSGLVQANFPLLLPAGSALRARLINNENSQAVHFFVTAKYHPADDLLTLTPDVRTGKVLKTVAR